MIRLLQPLIPILIWAKAVPSCEGVGFGVWRLLIQIDALPNIGPQAGFKLTQLANKTKCLHLCTPAMCSIMAALMVCTDNRNFV